MSVDIWLLETSLAGSHVIDLFRSVLSPEERERAGRFRFDRDRIAFQLAHGLTRITLARAAGCKPGDLRFGKNRYGRPHVEGPQVARGLGFNLSHAKGLVGVALVSGKPVGLDIEWIDHNLEPMTLGQRVFSDHELAAMRTLSHHERVDRFFRLWVLKESYIKARGMGLSIDLKSFAFDLDGTAPEFTPPPDDQKLWSFYLAAGHDEHRIATCTPAHTGDHRLHNGLELLSG